MGLVDADVLYRLIGERIRARRLELDVTQEDLGKAIGMLRTSVANIESGRQRAPLQTLYDICSVLRMQIQMLLPRPEEVTVQNTKSVRVGDQDREVPPMTADVLQRLLEE